LTLDHKHMMILGTLIKLLDAHVNLVICK
jgi:hypothetical protein